MNISLSSALKATCVLSLAFACGCDKKDGLKEIADGKNALEAKEPAAAAKLLEEGLSYAPENVDALVMLAQARLAQGMLPEAKQAIDKVEALAGGDVDVVLLKAQIDYHLREYDKAKDAFESVAKNKGNSLEIRADAMVGVGVVEYGRGNYDLARIAFFKAIQLNRKCSAAYYHLGRIYRDVFSYREAALDQFEKFAYLGDGADQRVRKVQQGFIPALKEEIARAAASLPGVSKRNSAACAAAISQAEAQAKNGGKGLKDAINSYQKAIEADPLSYPAALGLARTWARFDSSKNGLIKALEYYKLACTLNPASVSTYLAAGDIASRLGYYAQAVDIYSRAVAADSVNTTALNGLVVSLGRVGGKQKISEAYKEYRASLPATSRRIASPAPVAKPKASVETPKPAVKQEAKPATKPVAQPAPKPVAKNAAKNAVKPVTRKPITRKPITRKQYPKRRY